MPVPIKVGVYIPQDTSYPVIQRLAKAADQLGYHSLWFIDHLLERVMPMFG